MRLLKLVMGLIIFLSITSFAGSFGGGRSSSSSSFGGSRSSAPSRSYSAPSRVSPPTTHFGGNRSAGSSATITRASPRVANVVPPPRYSGAPVEHHYHNNSGGGGGGFLNGLLLGTILNRPSAPVMVSPGMVNGEMAPAVAVASEGHGFFHYLFFTLFWAGMCALIVWGFWKLWKLWRDNA